MSNPWENFEKPEENDNPYVDVATAGAKFKGKIKSVKAKTIPAGTFNYQEEDITGVPSIEFENGQRLDATQTVLKKELILLAPPVGSTISIVNLGKPKGKSYFDFDVEIVGADSIPFEEPKNLTSKPKNDQPPF